MRRRWIVVTAVLAALVLSTGSVLALSTFKDRPLDRQNLGVIDAHKTHSAGFVTLSGWGPSDSMMIEARAGIAATLSVTVSGGPVEFQMFLEDVYEGWAYRDMKPSFAAFDPGTGTTSGSFTFVKGIDPGKYTVNIRWRSPTGVEVHLLSGSLVVQYGAQ